MLRKFEVGCVYKVFDDVRSDHDSLILAVKVTRISADRKTVWFLESNTGAEFDEKKQSDIVAEYRRTRFLGLTSVHTREEAYFKDRPCLHFRARRFHRLHPFFPSHFFVHKDDGNGALEMYDFHKEIMKTFVLFLFSIKLIVLARRVKERMYAPGGIGVIAAEDNFGRVAKSQRIE